MSSHDKVRLEKGQLALLGPARIEVLTDNELARERDEVGYALSGIQATDDPSPEYGETEAMLLKKIKELDDESGRRLRSRSEPPKEPSMWDMLNKLAGNPDYAVCVMAWPWPDGGWMAGIALTDRGWAERQGMSPAILRLEESVGYHGLEWNCFDGFACGINTHSTDGPGAVKELLHKIKEIERELASKTPAFEPPKVTPVGNMHDLLQNVCHHDDEPKE